MSSAEDKETEDFETHSKSLDRFFYNSGQANLNNCDREPIHYIGSMQQNAGIIILAPESMELQGYSKNIAALFAHIDRGESPIYLTDFLPDLAKELRELASELDGYHALLGESVSLDERLYQVVFHKHDGHWLLELFPILENLSISAYRKKYNQAQTSCSAIMAASDFDSALDIAANSVRKISGFARVKIYKFQSDWSGKVIAESKEEHMPSFLGMYFPDTDIPKQARYLMTLVPYRSVVANSPEQDSPIERINFSTDAAPFDLSMSLLRSVSPIHLRYLRNMGVKATFGLSLLKGGKLWGLISCHHDEPKLMPFDIWEATKNIGSALMAKLDQEDSKSGMQMMRRLRKIEEQVATTIKENSSIELSLKEIMPQLRTFLRSDGFAFQYGTHLYTDGLVPPDEFINKLIHFASQRTEDQRSYSSDCLVAEWREAEKFKDIVSGALVEPVNLHRVCHLVWFRKPIVETVTWAGKNEPKERLIEEDGTETLLPRNSFEKWSEAHSNRSAEWTVAEIDAARELLKNMLDIVAAQLQLVQSNRDLEIFSFAAAHDLNAPLRHMNFALELMSQFSSAGSEIGDDKKFQEVVSMACTSYDRIRAVIDGMSNLLKLENKTYPMTIVSCEGVMRDVSVRLQDEITESKATLYVAKLPAVLGNEELLTTLLTNLILNSIKYRHPDRALHIDVGYKSIGTVCEIYVIDNGEGIPEDKRDEIFKPFTRLHSYDNKKGVGLGLAICVRSVESMGGTIHIDSNHDRPGTKVVVTLKLAADNA